MANNFYKGLALGAVVGAVAGVLYAPKSGKETREDIKNKSIEVKDNATKLYADARASLERKVTEIKKLNKKISLEKYNELVTEVINELKDRTTMSEEATKKLKQQLKNDYKKIESAVTA